MLKLNGRSETLVFERILFMLKLNDRSEKVSSCLLLWKQTEEWKMYSCNRKPGVGYVFFLELPVHLFVNAFHC